MIKYVLGFLFSAGKQDLLLIKKIKPKWQKGLYNGIGGKIEDGESSLEAMHREFEEETDIVANQIPWIHYATIRDQRNFHVRVYCAFHSLIYLAKTTTDEKIMTIHFEDIYKYPIISNLPWLIHLALDYENINIPITIFYQD